MYLEQADHILIPEMISLVRLAQATKEREMEILLSVICSGFMIGLIIFAGWMVVKSGIGSLVSESFLLVAGGSRNNGNSRGE